MFKEKHFEQKKQKHHNFCVFLSYQHLKNFQQLQWFSKVTYKVIAPKAVSHRTICITAL